VPAWLSSVRAEEYAKRFLARIEKKNKRVASDSFLKKRAELINNRYLGGRAVGFTIVWSERQKRVFGVCRQRKKMIRISARLKKAPLWVIDYLLLHELTHLLVPNHGKRFWRIVSQYPKTERARGFLRGVDFVSRS